MDRETAVKRVVEIRKWREGAGHTLKTHSAFNKEDRNALDFAIHELSSPFMACYADWDPEEGCHRIYDECQKDDCPFGSGLWNGESCTGGYWREYKEGGK